MPSLRMYLWWSLCTCGRVYVPLVESMYLWWSLCTSGGVYVPVVESMYLWWSLCTLYFLACQMKADVGDSDLGCYVTFFER